MVYAKGEGIVLNEPSVIALNTQTNDVLAMGHEAWRMIGRTPSNIVAVRPLRKGAITDFEITQRMIRLVLQRAGVNRFNRPRVVICVPSAITPVEQRAVTDAARGAGAVEVHLLEQPMAAAIGAGLAINEPMGNLVVDIGGGTSETALISLGGVVALEAVRVGSFDLDAAIGGHVRRTYGIAIGERTAEAIKIALGAAHPSVARLLAEVRGRELASGLPKTVVLSSDEVREAIREPVGAMVETVVRCLGSAPPSWPATSSPGASTWSAAAPCCGGSTWPSPKPPMSGSSGWRPRSSASCSGPGTASSPTTCCARCSSAAVPPAPDHAARHR